CRNNYRNPHTRPPYSLTCRGGLGPIIWLVGTRYIMVSRLVVLSKSEQFNRRLLSAAVARVRMVMTSFGNQRTMFVPDIADRSNLECLSSLTCFRFPRANL